MDLLKFFVILFIAVGFAWLWSFWLFLKERRRFFEEFIDRVSNDGK